MAKICLDCGTEIPATRQRCINCAHQQAILRQRARAALKRVGPDHVEGELARINAECDRRDDVSAQRRARYEAHLKEVRLTA